MYHIHSADRWYRQLGKDAPSGESATICTGLRRLVDGQSANLHLGSTQVCAGRSQDWIKVKNPDAPGGSNGGSDAEHA
jgi:hypothetical protein